MKNFSVIVGNVGQVHEGSVKAEAVRIYKEYVSLSKAKYGRVSQEPVTLFADHEPAMEYFPR